MDSEEESARDIEAKTVNSLEEGKARLSELAQRKLAEAEEKDRPIVIVVSGMPDAGKSTLIKGFVYEHQIQGEYKLEVGVNHGFEDVNKRWKGMPSKYLLIHTLGSRMVEELNAKQKGLKVDIYVFIYNPNLGQKFYPEESSDADIIIKNPDSINKWPSNARN